MKTFNDLKWEDKSSEYLGRERWHAVMFFPNGWGVSVIKGFGVYGDAQQPYELAVLGGTEESYDLHYDNPVAKGDVIGYQAATEINDLMQQVQALPQYHEGIMIPWEFDDESE